MNPDKGDTRLVDIETEEVSIVDKAANKWKFLVIKRQGAEGESLDKGISGKLAEVLLRIQSLKSMITSAEQAERPSQAFADEVLNLRMLLKQASGYQGPVCISGSPSSCIVSDQVKKQSPSILDEVARRLDDMIVSVEKVEVLSPDQERAIEGCADLIAKLSPLSCTVSKDRTSDVAKAIQNLAAIHAELLKSGPDSPASDGGIAELTKAVEPVVPKVADQKVEKSAAIPIVPASSIAPSEAEKKLEQIRKSLGCAEGVDAATLVAELAKDLADASIKPCEKGFQITDAKGKVLAEKATAAECLRQLLDAKRAEGAVGKTKEEAGAAKAAEDLQKLGKPMQSDRLNRLKSTVGLLKEAIIDLKAGSVNLEKFRKVGVSLSSIIDELETRKAAAMRRGFTEEPDPKCVGAGTDPAGVGKIEDALGEGVDSGLAQLLKTVEELKKAGVDQAQAISKRDAEIQSLRRDVTLIRNVRRAPSTVPADLERVAKSEGVYWPRDMSADSED